MKNQLKFSILLAIVVAIAVVAVALSVTLAKAAGTTYYVDCSAATNGNGTQASPLNSLASAISIKNIG